MKGDLDKALKGEPIYRHEDLKAISDKWDGLADFLQFSSLGGIFVIILILENVSKQTAKALVWYLAGILFVWATIAYFVAREALKRKMTYLNAEGKRVGEFLDEAIEKVKED